MIYYFQIGIYQGGVSYAVYPVNINKYHHKQHL